MNAARTRSSWARSAQSRAGTGGSLFPFYTASLSGNSISSTNTQKKNNFHPTKTKNPSYKTLNTNNGPATKRRRIKHKENTKLNKKNYSETIVLNSTLNKHRILCPPSFNIITTLYLQAQQNSPESQLLLNKEPVIEIRPHQPKRH